MLLTKAISDVLQRTRTSCLPQSRCQSHWVRAMLMVAIATGLLACSTSVAQTQPAPLAKNVILMISDGTGWFSWDAASYYEYGELGHQPYDAFPVKIPLTTFPAVIGEGENRKAHPGYDPAKAWDTTPIEPEGDSKHYFAGYRYLKHLPTDSAASATAYATGVKTYNAAISVGLDGQPLVTIAELAKEHGKAAGVISSVPLSHATPAAFAAHNENRNNYAQIGREMIMKSKLDVIMGAGHPLFDDEGKPRAEADVNAYRYIGGNWTWRQLTGERRRTTWTLIETRDQFEQLAADPASAPERALGLPQNGNKLQTTGAVPDDQRTTPDLATMARGAINVLSRNPNGFFLMIEGGAPDWAAHANDLEMLVHELVDFNHAVAAVCQWVEENSSWDQTLVIVTTDHGNGLLLGPDSDKMFFQPIVNNGKGQLPGARWHTGNHTNALVALWAKGAGAELLAKYATGEDQGLGQYVPGWGPAYADSTDVFKVMYEALLGTAPAPVTPPTMTQPASVLPAEQPATAPTSY